MSSSTEVPAVRVEQAASVQDSPDIAHATQVGHPAEQMKVDDNINIKGRADVPETESITYPTGAKLWLSMTSIILVALSRGLDLTIVAVAVPSLTNHFHTVKDIGWYSAAANLSLSAFTFFFGKLYAVFPLKRVFVSSTMIFTLGIVVCTTAPTSEAFILGRAIAGLGSGGVANGAVTLLSRLLPLEKRPTWFGILGAIQSVTLIAAPLIGGALIDSFSWRACFGINIPLCAIGVLFIMIGFPDPKPEPSEQQLTFIEKLKKLDIIGTLVIIPCTTCLFLALQWGGLRYSWSSPIIVVLLVLFGVLLLGFAYLQHRSGEQATLPPRILKNRNILGGAWFQACCDGTLAVTEYYISIYMQGVRGFSATKSGALGIPMIVGLMVTGLASGFGTSYFGYYAPFMILTTIIAPIPTGVLTTLSLGEPLIKPLACLGALGAAIGLGINGAGIAVNTVLQPNDIPIGNAILTFSGGAGASLFISASSALFQNRLVDELKQVGGNTTVLLDNAGLSDIRHVVRPDKLRQVLLGYDEAVTNTLYLPVALAVASLIGSASMEWRSVKKKTD
jgi:MFS family permease